MKKFVSGLIVGLMLFAGASAFADSSSLIGKKVQGLFSIEKNGTKIAEAVIINGSAYAPVRSIAEATGAGLTVEGKKIIMDSQITITTNNATKIEQLQGLKSIVENNIKVTKAEINMYETDVIPRAETAYQNSIGSDEEEGRKKWLDSMKTNYTQVVEKLTLLNEKLAEYETQIADLQK